MAPRNGHNCRLPVMMMPSTVAHRNHAAMRYFALHMLELDGGMVDAELVVQAVLHVAQDALADRRWDVGNCDVAGERAGFRPNTPAVQVVHVVDTVNGSDGGRHQLKLHAPRSAFEQNIQSFTHNAKAGPQDQHSDSQGKHWADPGIARNQNRPTTSDHRRTGKRVTNLVQ